MEGSRVTRREFPKPVRVAVIKRSMDQQGVIRCEKCGGVAKKFQIDHVTSDGLLGEPTLENAQLLGICCYTAKNAEDTAMIAKAKRREATHLGANSAPKRPLSSRGFARKARREAKAPVVGLTEIQRRMMEKE